MPGAQWWLRNGAPVPELQDVAVIVLGAVSAASAAERNWKEFDFVHNKRRNRLTAERAKSLVKVHSGLVLLGKAADGEEQEFHPWQEEESEESSSDEEGL